MARICSLKEKRSVEEQRHGRSSRTQGVSHMTIGLTDFSRLSLDRNTYTVIECYEQHTVLLSYERDGKFIAPDGVCILSLVELGRKWEAPSFRYVIVHCGTMWGMKRPSILLTLKNSTSE